jgi:hypothetical protein
MFKVCTVLSITPQGRAVGKFWLFCIFCVCLSRWENANVPKCALAKRGVFVIGLLRFGISLRVCHWLRTTVSGLAKVAILTTNVDAENRFLINHKCVCVALNRHFCQTRVSGSPFFSVVFVGCHFVSVLVR